MKTCLRVGVVGLIVVAVAAVGIGVFATQKGLSVSEMIELGSGVLAARASRHAVADRVASIEAKKPWLRSAAKSADGKLRILVFKSERRLEVHAPGWGTPRVYPMTGFSGALGPESPKKEVSE